MRRKLFKQKEAHDQDNDLNDEVDGILDVADGKTANRQFEALPIADGNVRGHFQPKMTQIRAKSGQIPGKMRQKCEKKIFRDLFLHIY